MDTTTIVGMGWAGIAYPLCFVAGLALGVWVGYKLWKRKALDKLKLEFTNLKGKVES